MILCLHRTELAFYKIPKIPQCADHQTLSNLCIIDWMTEITRISISKTCLDVLGSRPKLQSTEGVKILGKP